MKRIYLDNNATTAVDPKVLKKVFDDLSGPPANPSSVHWFGMKAKQKLIEARDTCASFFRASPEEILFTSSGTESIHFMLNGLNRKGHLITTNTEHSAMEKAIQGLEAEGMKVTWLPSGLLGAPNPEAIEEAICSDTQAIALSLSNGETGVRLDLEKIYSIAEKNKIPLLLDGVAFIGKEPFTPHPAIHALAISGHKFHAPKGIGLLFHKKRFPLSPLFLGGGQEYNLRSGTENLSGILGLTTALEILKEEQQEITEKILALRLHFENELFRSLDNIAINGKGKRISNTSNLAFLGVDGETLLMQLDLAGIAASHGSACSSGALEPSRILLGMGIDRKQARSSIRFSFARTNTKEEIDQALEIIVQAVRNCLKIS